MDVIHKITYSDGKSEYALTLDSAYSIAEKKVKQQELRARISTEELPCKKCSLGCIQGFIYKTRVGA